MEGTRTFDRGHIARQQRRHRGTHEAEHSSRVADIYDLAEVSDLANASYGVMQVDLNDSDLGGDTNREER